jgi:hypothetical protein
VEAIEQLKPSTIIIVYSTYLQNNDVCKNDVDVKVRISTERVLVSLIDAGENMGKVDANVLQNNSWKC